MATCHNCGTTTPMHLLDGKPKRLAGPITDLNALSDAADRGEEFDRLECQSCYGLGYAPLTTDPTYRGE